MEFPLKQVATNLINISMNTLNLKIVILITCFLTLFSCKAQTYALNTDYNQVPNYSYLKDLDNELQPFVGVYKANYQGKEITLSIIKQEHYLKERTSKTYYMDALFVTFEVKNSAGIVLQNSQTVPNTLFYSISTDNADNSVTFSYSGTNCGIGWGKIYLTKLNSTQFLWEYYPNHSTLTEATCPGNPDLTIYLPDTKDLIFTKQ